MNGTHDPGLDPELGGKKPTKTIDIKDITDNCLHRNRAHTLDNGVQLPEFDSCTVVR